MGMDVIGRNAVDVSGEHFRASVWSWRPLHELMKKLCSDLVDDRCLDDMQFNCGAGPKDPRVCKTMSARFRAWLASWKDDAYFLEEAPTIETPEGMVFGLLESSGLILCCSALCTLETRSPSCMRYSFNSRLSEESK